MSERVVKVRLSAQVAEYQQGMLDAAKSTREVGSEAEKLAQKREAFNMLGAAGVGVGTAMLAASGLAVKAAMSWQSAWTGVTKTVEGTPEQLAAVEQGLRDLTGVLPASHEEIAAVAEAAGQLGIETPNVVAFTKTMIDMGESTNLSSEEAAVSLARFMNIMGTSQDQVSNLGSAIVGLGNNYATTEREIMEMAMRLAGAGKQVGLSEGEVLGLATALSSVGIEAEAGGSAVSKVLIDIAANADKGGAKFEKYASTAGMTAEQFKKLWQANPAEALSAFVKGLANAEAQGSSTLGVLADLGITEVRMRDALLRSSSAADQFAGAMKMGSSEFEKNNALTEEASKRYATAESKLRMAGNAIKNAAIDLGQVLLPAVTATADGVKALANFVDDLPEPLQGLIAVGGAVAGSIVLVGGAASLAVPKIAEYKIALQTLKITGDRVRGTLGNVVDFLGGPWGVALTVAVAAVAELAMEHQRAEAKAQAYADTLEDGSRRITNATREMIAQNMQVKQGGFAWLDGYSIADNARELGISLETVRKAIEGNADALTELDTKTQAAIDGYNFFDSASIKSSSAAQDLRNQVEGETGSLDKAAQAARDKAEATQGVANSTGESANAAKTAADAYLDEATQVSDLASQMSKLIDQINEANGVNQDAVTANAQYQEALEGIADEVQRQRDEYEKLNETTDGFAASLDESTAAGASNAAMLSDVARSAQDAAKAQYEVDKTTMSAKDATDKYAGTLAAQRQAFIDSAVQAGFNADQVQVLADKVFALPSAKEVAILAQTAAAQNAIDQFITLNDGKRVKVFVDAEGGQSFRVGSTTVSPGNANGAIYDKGVKAFADSGFEPGIYGYRPGGIHKFAEAFSEAYISMDPARAPRSKEVWYETGSRLGLIGSAPSAPGISVGDMLRLVVDGHEFTAYVDGRAGSVAAGQISNYDTEQSRAAGRRRN